MRGEGKSGVRVGARADRNHTHSYLTVTASEWQWRPSLEQCRHSSSHTLPSLRHNQELLSEKQHLVTACNTSKTLCTTASSREGNLRTSEPRSGEQMLM